MADEPNCPVPIMPACDRGAAPPIAVPPPPPVFLSGDAASCSAEIPPPVCFRLNSNEPPPIDPPPVATEELPLPALEGVELPAVVSFEARIRGMLPWTISACLNLLVTLCLAMVVLPLLGTQSQLVELSVLPWTEDTGEQVATFEMELSDSAPQRSTEVLDMANSVEPILDIKTDAQVDSPLQLAMAAMNDAPRERGPLLPGSNVLDMPVSVSRAYNPPTEKELRQAESVEDAVDGIARQIRNMLLDDDLLVVWLLDSSLSLVDDRQRIADRLDQVYSEIDRDRRAKYQIDKQPYARLRNAVVAYGGNMLQVVAPTSKSKQAVEAVRTIPIDATGLENVFGTVQTCVARYADSARTQVMVVVWTDESGDDILLLEPTIALCRERNVRVNVIGPTAVLGAEPGTHAYVHPANGQLYWLPVKKGPDTAFPERMLWPYWWRTTSLPTWHDSSIATARGGYGWYGGPDLAGMASGFPPYALTRLTRETGGTYTVFDRPMDRGPFTIEQMRTYAPDHRAAIEIYNELHYFPLRHAVMASVETTRKIDHRRPPMQLPFMYIGPAAIRQTFKRWAKESAEAIVYAEVALKPFGPDGLETQYEAETSPRWRAWYDLTRGRLLAQSVRHTERIAMCELSRVQRGAPENANCMEIGPVQQIISGPEVEKRAAEAERLLRRCIAQNPGTPWAYLAERELAFPVGIGCRLWYQEPPPPVPVTPSMPAPQITLPQL